MLPCMLLPIVCLSYDNAYFGPYQQVGFSSPKLHYLIGLSLKICCNYNVLLYMLRLGSNERNM